MICVDAVGGADVAGTGIARAAHAAMMVKTWPMRVMDRTNRMRPGLLTTDRIPLAKPKTTGKTVNGGGGGAVGAVGAASDLEKARASRWRKPEALATFQRLQKLWTR